MMLKRERLELNMKNNRLYDLKNKFKIKEEINEILKSEESLLLIDNKDEYHQTLRDSGYEILKLDITDLDNSFYTNIFGNVNELYNNKKIDEVVNNLQTIGELLYKSNDETMDPFWNNSACSLFIGISLYVLETKGYLTVDKVIRVAQSELEEFQKYVNEKDVLDIINVVSSSSINAPLETKGGIVSVLMQKLSLIARRPNLLKHLISNEKWELKNKKQALIINMSEITNSFPNLLCEIIVRNIIDELYEKDINYNLVFVNYDDLINKEYYEDIFKTSNWHQISCIVGVDNLKNIKRIESFSNLN